MFPVAIDTASFYAENHFRHGFYQSICKSVPYFSHVLAMVLGIHFMSVKLATVTGFLGKKLMASMREIETFHVVQN